VFQTGPRSGSEQERNRRENSSETGPDALGLLAPNEQISCTAESLNEWVEKAEIDSRPRAGVPAEIAERLKAVERENRELGQVNEIMRKPSAFGQPKFRPPGQAMIAFMDGHRQTY
jgi:transposase